MTKIESGPPSSAFVIWSFLRHSSFVLRHYCSPGMLSPPGDPAHLGLGERLALFDGLFHGAQHNFLDEFDVVWRHQRTSRAISIFGVACLSSINLVFTLSSRDRR